MTEYQERIPRTITALKLTDSITVGTLNSFIRGSFTVRYIGEDELWEVRVGDGVVARRGWYITRTPNGVYDSYNAAAFHTKYGPSTPVE